jgi:hypothetical protein
MFKKNRNEEFFRSMIEDLTMNEIKELLSALNSVMVDFNTELGKYKKSKKMKGVKKKEKEEIVGYE